MTPTAADQGLDDCIAGAGGGGGAGSFIAVQSFNGYSPLVVAQGGAWGGSGAYSAQGGTGATISGSTVATPTGGGEGAFLSPSGGGGGGAGTSYCDGSVVDCQTCSTDSSTKPPSTAGNGGPGSVSLSWDEVKPGAALASAGTRVVETKANQSVSLTFFLTQPSDLGLPDPSGSVTLTLVSSCATGIFGTCFQNLATVPIGSSAHSNGGNGWSSSAAP